MIRGPFRKSHLALLLVLVLTTVFSFSGCKTITHANEYIDLTVDDDGSTLQVIYSMKAEKITEGWSLVSTSTTVGGISVSQKSITANEAVAELDMAANNIKLGQQLLIEVAATIQNGAEEKTITSFSNATANEPTQYIFDYEDEEDFRDAITITPSVISGTNIYSFMQANPGVEYIWGEEYAYRYDEETASITNYGYSDGLIFHHHFSIPGVPKTAQLQIGANYGFEAQMHSGEGDEDIGYSDTMPIYTMAMNTEIAEELQWDKIYTYDISDKVSQGDNLLCISAIDPYYIIQPMRTTETTQVTTPNPFDFPAGLAFKLTATYEEPLCQSFSGELYYNTTPGLALTKTASPTHVKPGENVSYTLKVTNNSDFTLYNVSVTDPMFPDLLWQIDELGSRGSRTYDNPLTRSFSSTGTYTNTATATGYYSAIVSATTPQTIPIQATSETATSTSTALPTEISLYYDDLVTTTAGAIVTVSESSSPQPPSRKSEVRYQIEISVEGDGSVLPGEGTHTLGSGTVQILSVTPGEGSSFIGWFGENGSEVTPYGNNYGIVVNQNKKIIARFADKVSVEELPELPDVPATPEPSPVVVEEPKVILDEQVPQDAALPKTGGIPFVMPILLGGAVIGWGTLIRKKSK